MITEDFSFLGSWPGVLDKNTNISQRGLLIITNHSLCISERGVVWEETIILLPDNVHYVFLSATIPNARQFAEWICHLHKQVECCTGS